MLIDIVLPILFAALVWWASTGAIIWLVGRDASTYRWTAMGASLVMAGAMAGVALLREDASLGGAYLGFAAGLALWAWHEVMFLLGYISGVRRTPCPPGLAPWPRFRVSAETVIHHELGIALHAALIVWVSLGAANQFAMWTFLLLWGMRLSAKLVVFLGAPNITDAFLPAHLGYLKSYFQKRAATGWFPLLVTLVTAVAAGLVFAAANQPAGQFQAAGLTLLATLAALAVIEHWALVAPLPDAPLWAWAVRQPPRESRDGPAPQGRPS